MEIKGDDFLKRIQVQQERDELEQKLSELEEVDQTLKQTPPSGHKIDEFPDDNHELDNIMLETANSNEDNKKMYLGLIAALIILFLSIIVIYGLFNDDSKEDPFTADKTESLEEVKAKEESNIDQSFQKIMNEKRKEETKEKIISDEQMDEIKPVVNEVKKVEVKKESIPDDALDETIKKIEQQRKAVKKEEPKKVAFKKPEVKEVKKVQSTKSVKDLMKNTSNSTSSPKGYFVQIGAFTKKPSNSYINKIRNAGYKYKIYKVEVKGRLYNKVLIGPYSSKAVAKQNIESIKKSLGLSGAYVLKF